MATTFASGPSSTGTAMRTTPGSSTTRVGPTLATRCWASRYGRADALLRVPRARDERGRSPGRLQQRLLRQHGRAGKARVRGQDGAGLGLEHHDVVAALHPGLDLDARLEMRPAAAARRGGPRAPCRSPLPRTARSSRAGRCSAGCPSPRPASGGAARPPRRRRRCRRRGARRRPPRGIPASRGAPGCGRRRRAGPST